ncbi:MAG: hypothetical protein BroJett015_29460 [Chloroflexota bacterium]|nr:MAG: hypothetical protein BroJett015_29460 [Chloroflexota bacterium]
MGGKVGVAVGTAVSAGNCTAVWLAALSTTTVATGVAVTGEIESVGTGVGTAVGAAQAANPTRHKMPTKKKWKFNNIRIGEWGLEIGDWMLGRSPISNLHSCIKVSKKPKPNYPVK